MEAQPADPVPPTGPRDSTRPSGRRTRLRTAVRTVGSTVLLVGLYLGRPLDRPTPATLALLVAGLVLLVLLLGWQIRSVVRSPYPVLRAIEAFVTATVLFIVLFAAGYTSLSEADPDAFSEPVDRLDALYFTMTVLATVGFGDITPVTGPARVVVTVQMVCGFAFAALVGREFLAAVRRAQDGDQGDGATAGR
ncbi:potassium channel family protein [Cellulomonas sp. IC4_254]|uniref:potassium channel family protein n=1 Tax=Cellulomonas sp. IC4_254 TaxID=2714040 RepID=UPI0014233AAE|nr:potassium channel family protein [Cellulomonas sp. IC4_254]NHT16332.1 two pore domain potassium channel family protein [Cellulomonas sp. IC4_254]